VVMKSHRVVAVILTAALGAAGMVAPASAAPKADGQLVVRVAGPKKAPKRLRIKGPVKRSVKVGSTVSLPAGTYRLAAPRVKKLRPRGVPKRIRVRRGALTTVDVLYGKSYLTKGRPVKVRLAKGGAKVVRDGGKLKSGGTRVTVPDQYGGDLEVQVRTVKSAKRLGPVKGVHGVVLDWQGQLSAPITIRFGSLKRQAVVFGSAVNGSQTHFMPRRRTITVDRPGAYFVADRGMRSTIVRRGFMATMPWDVPSKLEHIVGAKTVTATVRSSSAASTLAAGTIDDVLAELAAEVDYIKTYVLPVADQLAADCSGYKEALNRVLVAERLRQLLGSEGQDLLEEFVGGGRFALAVENCVREIAEPCVKPADVGDVLGYVRTLILFRGEEEVTAYLEEVAQGVLSGERICKTVAVPRRLVGTISATQRQQWGAPGYDRVTTWQASVTLELAWVGPGLDPPFEEAAQYRVTALDGTWTKSGSDGIECTRSGQGSLELADLPPDHLRRDVVYQGLPIYTNPWQGFVYAMNMQSSYRIWPSTVTCTPPPPDAQYQYVDQEESPYSFLSTNRWDLLDPLPPLQSGRDPAGTYTLDDWPFHRTTWTWNLKAEADEEFLRPVRD